MNNRNEKLTAAKVRAATARNHAVRASQLAEEAKKVAQEAQVDVERLEKEIRG